MNPLLAANAALSALDVLNIIGRKNPRFKKLIDQSLAQGNNPDEIVAFLQGKGLPAGAQIGAPAGFTESERSDRMRDAKMQSLLGSLKGAIPQILGLGAAGYGLYKGAQGLRNLFGNAQGGGASNLPQGPPTPSQGPTASPITQAALNLNPTASPITQSILQAKPKGPIPTGPNFASIARQVINSFGFKNKPLVNLVSQIVEKTGEEVEDIYNKLKVNDISTAEKASGAAKQMLENLTKDLLPQGKGLDKNVRKAEDIKKDIAKDLSSSVIYKTDYEPDNQKLKVVFTSGNTYRYDDVPEDIYEKFTEAGTPAKTDGQNPYGIWWKGKNPSLGATFNKLIKEGGFPYERIEEGEPPPTSPSKGKSFVSSLKKAEKAVMEKPSVKKGLTADQAIARINTYKKQLSNLKGEDKEKRKEEILKFIEDRQKDLERIEKLKKNKKTKVFTDELIKFEKSQGKNLIKKIIPMLPYALANSVKKQFDNLDEINILNMILKSLKK